MMQRKRVFASRVTNEKGYKYKYVGNKLIRKARGKPPEESTDNGKTWKEYNLF